MDRGVAKVLTSPNKSFATTLCGGSPGQEVSYDSYQAVSCKSCRP